jgi:hypothetical protein
MRVYVKKEVAAQMLGLSIGEAKLADLPPEVDAYALAFELPILTPTPLIREFVIPSRHTPPESRGETRPNDAYNISGWKLVEPTQVEVLDPTPNVTLTLISCYPYLIDTQRIIVTGQLVD